MTNHSLCLTIEHMCALGNTSQQARHTDAAASLVSIVREETANGRLIVRFLVSAMQGELKDAKPSHRLSAARILVSIGFDDARTFIDRGSPASSPRSSRHDRHAGGHFRAGPDPELAAIVRQETDGGRAAVRFLVDVMLGSLPGFKPNHRLAAARELLRQGFYDAVGANSPQDTLPEPQPEPGPEPKPEVPEGFVIAPEGDITPDVFNRNHVIRPQETLFSHRGYRDWLRQKKEEGRTILKPGWWQEGLEEFVDEDALTMSEAVQEAADAQGITVAPHLLDSVSPEPASGFEAGPPEELGPRPEVGPGTSKPQEQDSRQVFVEERDTDVPWSKPGYYYRDELSETELRVLEKGGVLHWDAVAHRFP